MNNFDNYMDPNMYNQNMNNNQHIQNNTQTTLYNPYQGFIRGNMFPNLYNTYKLSAPFEIEPLNEQADMLTNIDSYSFALVDLNLYLDIYPNDKNLIDLYNRYRVQKNELVKTYEEKYGPLYLNSDALVAFPWAWDNDPWPWDR